VKLERGLFGETEPSNLKSNYCRESTLNVLFDLNLFQTPHHAASSINQTIDAFKMPHSIKNRQKRQRWKTNLQQRVKSLERLANRNNQTEETITLPKVALGDLREKWKQWDVPLDDSLRKKVKKFRRIKISKDKPLRIVGSDGGLLVYAVALNEPELVDGLFDSIKALPVPKHYKFKGKKRGDYLSRHFTVWAKYSKTPYLSKEYLDDEEAAKEFLEGNKEVWKRMSGILGQAAPGVFKEFQTYPLPEGLNRLSGAWLGCAINDGGNSPNQTNVHRDASEVLYGYSGLISTGDYSRGGLILWDLEIILETEPGDVVIFQDAVIRHSNEKAEGNRSSVVCFTQENVYSYWNRQFGLRLRRKERHKKRVVKGRIVKP
jgi:hypothetical protein